MTMEELLKDPRFAHIPKDPKFRRIPKSERKVKIDKRFQSMFTDKRFTVKYTIDKRGRPINQSSSEDLKKYYDLSSSDIDSDDDDDDDDDDDNDDDNEKNDDSKPKEAENIKSNKNAVKQKRQTKVKNIDSADIHDGTNENTEANEDDDKNDSDASDASETSRIDQNMLDENEKQLILRKKNENKIIAPDIKKKLKNLTVDYARGEGALFSDSSSDEESSEEEEEDEDIEHNWGEMDKDAATTDEVTTRLAVCNMDWDRIRAVDLMVLLNSFLPPGGFIHSVTIYPSEFGLERMKEEEIKGPSELVHDKIEDELDEQSGEESDDQNVEGSEFHMEKMRKYQLNRLKYYYAVVVFDSKESANKVYTECDGIEYESTATKLDLRFIPDDMTFDQEPKDSCNKLPEVTKYKPRQFTTTALQQVKVELTWDETKPERKEITQRLNSGKIDDVDDYDIQAYLASGTSDDDSDGPDNNEENDEQNTEEQSKDNMDPIEKYKSLLKSIEEKEEEKKKKDVELEFTWGLGMKEKTEKLVKEKIKKMENLTVFEQYLEKRKEKKKAKREKKKLNKNEELSDEEISDSEDSIPSDVDMNDPYFAEEMKNMKSKDKKKKNKNRNDKVSNDFEDEDDIQKKSELELLMLDREDDGKHHFDMKKIEENESLSKSKKKRLSKKKKKQKEEVVEDNFEVNVNDSRFAALFNSHHFNIDPADPHYRKTKGTEALVKEKLKRRADKDDNNEDSSTKQPKKDGKMSNDLAALVKMVKKNTKNISKPIK